MSFKPSLFVTVVNLPVYLSVLPMKHGFESSPKNTVSGKRMSQPSCSSAKSYGGMNFSMNFTKLILFSFEPYKSYYLTNFFSKV